MSDQKTILDEINAVVGEVTALLRKSNVNIHLHKDGDDAEEMTPPADDMSAAPAPGPAEMPADAIADQGGEGAPMDAPEGLEGEAEEAPEDLAAEAQGLSDEDLDAMLEVLMAEKESRQGEQAPEAPVEEAPAPAEDPAQKSMKDDMSKLGKSLDSLLGSIEALNKKVDGIAAKPAQAKVSVKAPAANSQDVQVLHKSAPVAQRLSKSDTLEFAQGQQRKGNKVVNASVIHDIMSAQEGPELHKLQDSLTKAGIEFPKL